MITLKMTAFGAGIVLAACTQGIAASACPPGFDCGMVVNRGSGESCFHFVVHSNVSNKDVLYGISYNQGDLVSEAAVGGLISVPGVGQTVSLKPSGPAANCQNGKATEARAITTPALP